MDISDSECSSGCESGWTLYLEQSFSSQKRSGKNNGFCETRRKEKQLMAEEDEDEEEEEEEEDLSMVSDASSGPPHFHEEEEEENKPCNASKRQNMKEKPFACGDQDDTASSPLFNFSDTEDFPMTDNRGSVEGVLDYSQGFSATHFQRRRRPAFQDPFGFLHSSFSENQLKQMSDLKGIRR